MYTTYHVAQKKVTCWLDNKVIRKLNEATLDFMSVFGPAERLCPESTKA